MIRVYTASKLSSAPIWREWQSKWPHVIFHARWLRHTEIGTPDTKEHAARFWVEDEEDVKTADAVLIYAKPEEHLRGALVEAGIAIANTKPIIVIGDHPDYGTWQYYPSVVAVSSFEDAGAILQALDDSKRPPA